MRKVLNKIDRILYEASNKEIAEFNNIPFDDLVEKLAKMPRKEVKKIIPKLKKSYQDEVKELIAGGLL